MVACVVFVGLLGALGVGLSLRSGGFEIERGSDEGQSAVVAGEEAAGNETILAASQSGGSDGDEDGVSCFVHVDGAVLSPGVYKLPGETVRVCDAVEAAGGLSAEADVSGLNLAAKVADGTKVHVPTAAEVEASGQQSEVASAAGGGTASGSSASASSGSAATGGSSLVNINTATVEELDELPGVGPSTAQAIVDDREQNGPFASPEDLMRVSGIGEKKFAKLEGSICV